MAVFVDDMQAPYGRMVMCHMLATNDDELHAMADHIGISRRWHQGDHYDICKAKRALAVKAGAVEITRREAALMRSHRRLTGRGMTADELRRASVLSRRRVRKAAPARQVSEEV